MADRNRECVRRMRRRRLLLQAEDRLHHSLDLLLVGTAVAADHLLDSRGRVLSAGDACVRGCHQNGAARLPDRECGTGVGADERFLERDGIRRVPRDEVGHRVVDRLQPKLWSLRRGRRPPPVLEGPEVTAVFVDDRVPARCRSWIDSDDFHVERLGVAPDVSCRRGLTGTQFGNSRAVDEEEQRKLGELEDARADEKRAGEEDEPPPMSPQTGGPGLAGLTPTD